MISSILVYSGLELMGDGLMKLPFLRALRHAYPDASITWLAGKGKTVYADALFPLVADLIDEIIEDAGIGTAWHEVLRKPLPDRAFDLVIDTQRRVKTTLIVKRIRHKSFISGAAKFRFSDRTPPQGAVKQRRMVDALLSLVAAATGQAPECDLSLTLDPIYTEAAATLLPTGKTAIGLAPGAGGIHKRWPLENFIALAQTIVGQNLVPVFLLGPDEGAWQREIGSSVPSALFPLQDPTVTTSVRASPLFTIAIAQRLAAAVANDSGTGHMIAAADTPLLSLFGPTDPAKFAPYVSKGAVLRAQDWRGEAMATIPLGAVEESLQKLLKNCS